MSRKEGGRRFVNFDVCIEALIEELKEKSEINFRGNNTIGSISTDRKKSRKQKWWGKQLYEYFKRQTGKIDYDTAQV